jgi:glycosyltransferase involved in cell wall biosynthesis
VNEVLLSASLIVKNEERFLEGCLQSIAGIADEVVIADTGSTDRSRQIAQSYGASVFEFPWTGDFAAARNAALERASGRWILYIDADERLRPCPRRELRGWLEDDRVIGYRVLFHVRPGYTAYRELRLFRNHPQIRFEGAIHETIWPQLLRYRARHGGDITACPLTLDHFGYEGDQSGKIERNLRLLLASLDENPDRSFHWCHLARTYEELGEHDKARSALEIAVDRVRRKRHRQPVDSLPFASLVEFRMTRGDDADALLDESLRLFPGNLQFHWFRGRRLIDQGRYADAIPVFEWLLERGRLRDFDDIAGYDARLFDVLSFESLGTCLYKLHRYADAARFYQLAAAAEATSMEYRLKAKLCADLACQAGGPPE